MRHVLGSESWKLGWMRLSSREGGGADDHVPRSLLWVRDDLERSFTARGQTRRNRLSHTPPSPHRGPQNAAQRADPAGPSPLTALTEHAAPRRVGATGESTRRCVRQLQSSGFREHPLVVGDQHSELGAEALRGREVDRVEATKPRGADLRRSLRDLVD
jgi:hypothetical protein